MKRIHTIALLVAAGSAARRTGRRQAAQDRLAAHHGKARASAARSRSAR